jgi:hypothetical protein
LVDIAVNRQELAMPPSLKLDQIVDFNLYMIKAILNGRGDEIVDLAAPTCWTGRGARRKLEDHRLVPVAENAPVQVPADGAREDHALQVAAPRATRSSTWSRCEMRATSCSMIGPSSSTSVT